MGPVPVSAGRGPGMTAVCPSLGDTWDAGQHVDRPSHNHRCYALVLPASISLDNQRRYCLGGTWAHCPIFRHYSERAEARP